MVHAQYIWILLSALIHLSRRWKRVRFELPAHGIFLQPLATLSESDVPILQSASIDFPIAPTDDPNWTSVGFIATPSLRSVSMVCYMWHPVPELPIRYKNLRHLKINCIASSALQSIVQMLRKCPVLETCVLYAKDSRHSRYPAQISTPFRMEHLSRLRVTDPRCTTETLFQHLVLPQLRILEFICSRTTLLTRPLPFASIFSSADRLECLHITQGSGALSTSSLVEVLALAPMLQELHMIGEPSMEGTPNPADNPVDLITMLTPGAVGAAIILCPELQRVKLERFRDVTDSTLLEFIQARTGPHPQDVAHLSSVDVWFDREQQADIFPPLQNVIATGLKLSVVYDPPTRPLYSPFEALVQEDPGWETW
ncbi:hypothetical protein B0H10DRAFT_2023240 [Mycena sp. CBHHK59/15]|nr:hypothetical protein B0H10DRAFT_2023240 [Mycena sp. CBHHK59/15]